MKFDLELYLKINLFYNQVNIYILQNEYKNLQLTLSRVNELWAVFFSPSLHTAVQKCGKFEVPWANVTENPTSRKVHSPSSLPSSHRQVASWPKSSSYARGWTAEVRKYVFTIKKKKNYSNNYNNISIIRRSTSHTNRVL